MPCSGLFLSYREMELTRITLFGIPVWQIIIGWLIVAVIFNFGVALVTAIWEFIDETLVAQREHRAKEKEWLKIASPSDLAKHRKQKLRAYVMFLLFGIFVSLYFLF